MSESAGGGQQGEERLTLGGVGISVWERHSGWHCEQCEAIGESAWVGGVCMRMCVYTWAGLVK